MQLESVGQSLHHPSLPPSSGSSSIFLVLALAFERFLAVCRPYEYRVASSTQSVATRDAAAEAEKVITQNDSRENSLTTIHRSGLGKILLKCIQDADTEEDRGTH